MQTHLFTRCSDKRLGSHNALQRYQTLTKPFFSARSDRHIPSESARELLELVFPPLLPRHTRYLLSTSHCLLYTCSLNEVTKTCPPHTYNQSSIPFQEQRQQYKGRNRWRESKVIMATWNLLLHLRGKTSSFHYRMVLKTDKENKDKQEAKFAGKERNMGTCMLYHLLNIIIMNHDPEEKWKLQDKWGEIQWTTQSQVRKRLSEPSQLPLVQ